MKTWKSGGIPYGYRFNSETKTLEVHPSESATLKKIFALALDGKGVTIIANFLNEHQIPSKQGKEWYNVTVNYILRPDKLMFYLGVYKDGSKGNWKPLLTKDDYKKIISFRRVIATGTKSVTYLLTTDFHNSCCAFCGSKLRTTRNISHVYYSCSRKLSKGKDSCEKKITNADKVNNLVVAHIHRYAKEMPKHFHTYLKIYETQLKALSESFVPKYKSLVKYLGLLTNIKEKLETPAPIKYKPIFTNAELLANYISRITLSNTQIILEYKTPINSSMESIVKIDL